MARFPSPLPIPTMHTFGKSYSLAIVASLLSLAALQNALAAPWVNTGGLNLARDLHTATLLPNGQVLIAGGVLNTGSTTNGVELYDPASGTSKFSGSMAL